MNKTRVLITEDEAISAIHLKEILAKQDFEVLDIADSGEDAIEKAEILHPEIVLMDIVLKGKIDGITAGQMIIEKFDIPLVYLTAYSDDLTLKRAMETSPYGYILKPINDNLLITSLEFALHKHTLEKNLIIDERRYHTIVEYSGSVIIALTPDFRIVEFNSEAERIFGVKRKAAIGKDYFKLFVPPDDQHLLKADIKKILNGNSVRDFENTVYSKDGTKRILLWNITTISKSRKTSPGIIFFGRDITDRKNADNTLREKNAELQAAKEAFEISNKDLIALNKKYELQNRELMNSRSELVDSSKLLLESQNQYCTLFDKMIDGYALHEMIFDEQGNPVDYRFLDMNPAFEELTGFSRDIIGKRILEILPAIESSWIETYGNVVRTGKAARFENFSREINKWFEVVAYRPDTNLFACFFTDITSRKRCELELQNNTHRLEEQIDTQAKSLQESKRRYKKLIEEIPDIVYSFSDKKGGIYYSPRVADILEHPVSYLYKNPYLWYNSIHPDDREHIKADIKKLKNGKIDDIEYRIMDKNEKWHWFRDRIISREETGDGIIFHRIATDITLQKEAENKLRDAHQQLINKTTELERANSDLSQYAYVVSHDLKSPLRAIHNYADFITEDLQGNISTELEVYLNGMRQAIRQGQDLINDLLKYSRIGRHFLKIEKIDMQALLKKIITMEDPHNESEVIITNPLPQITSDKILLWQIFQNLVSNALKFNTSQPRRVEICYDVSPEPNHTFYIFDNGIGIDIQFQDKIFLIFQRLHIRTEFEGTGIGLAIVKKALEKLHGSIQIASEPGTGSTFTISIPEGTEV